MTNPEREADRENAMIRSMRAVTTFVIIDIK